MAQCLVNYWWFEVISTDFIALHWRVPNRNLQGLPKHLNGHPRVSEQNLLPFNMVWRIREASRPPGDPALERPRIRPHQDFQPNYITQGREGDSHPPDPTPTHQTPQHREGRREGTPTQPHHNPHQGSVFPNHLGGGGGGHGARDHIYICIYVHICKGKYTYTCVYT